MTDLEIERVARVAFVRYQRYQQLFLGAGPQTWKAAPDVERATFREHVRRVVREGATARDLVPAYDALPHRMQCAWEFVVEAIKRAAADPSKEP